MSDQQVKYTITADASQANSELARVDKAAASLVGNEKALATETAKATAAITEQGKVASTAAVATAKAAGSTRNMGQAGLEASRAMEDLQYGIGGVVNNIPSLVMALGGGAGLTAAISLGAVAVNQLAKNFGAVDPAAKEATAAAAAHVKGLRGEIEGLAQDLRSLQVGAERAAMEMQGSIVAKAANAASAALDPLGGIGRFERLKDRSDLPLTIKENIETAKKAMATLDDEMAKLAGMRRIQLEKESQRNIDQAVDRANAEEEAIGKARNGARDKINIESEVRSLIAEQERQDEMIAKAEMAYEAMAEKEIRILMERDQKISDLASTAFKKQEDERKRNQDEANKEKLRQEKKSLKDIEAEQERHAKQNEQYATQAVGIVTGATQQYVEARIKGEKNAEAAFAASIMAQAGQALVSYGVQAIGRGVLEASSPLTAALAPASFAAGAGLIVAGTGLGGIGAGVGQLAAGGTIGKAIPDDKAAKDKGASPGRNSGSGGGGPLVVNVAYGAGGPLPEDTAREIQKAVDTGRRRGGR